MRVLFSLLLSNRHAVLTIWIFIALVICSLGLHAESLLIRNARIITGANPSPSAPRDVFIDSGHIAGIGRHSGAADRTLDAEGRYLIPGLIDTHVHLGEVPGVRGINAREQTLIESAMAQIPRSYLYFGFTTVLELVGVKEPIDQWNAKATAPRAYFCAPVTIANGYPLAWLEGERQFQVQTVRYMLFDERQAETYPQDFNPARHTPEAVVKKALDDGARCIKFFYETGFGPQQNLPVPTEELAARLIAAAREADLSIFLHGNSQSAYEFGKNVEVDVLVHGMWHWDKLRLDRTDEIDAFAKSIVAKGIAIQPTIQVIYGEQELFNRRFFNDNRIAKVMPTELIEWYQSADGQWMKDQMTGNLQNDIEDPDELYRFVQGIYEKPLTQVKTMSEAIANNGGNVLFGSDTPSGPIYTQFPGINGRLEMDRWLEAGFDLKQLFAAMTIGNAEAIKLESSIGSIEEGKRADLLLLKENPLQGVGAYDSISHVILYGKIIEREQLAVQNHD